MMYLTRNLTTRKTKLHLD